MADRHDSTALTHIQENPKKQEATVPLSLLDEKWSLDKVHTQPILSPSLTHVPGCSAQASAPLTKAKGWRHPAKATYILPSVPRLLRHSSEWNSTAEPLGDLHSFHPEPGDGVNSPGLSLTSGVQEPTHKCVPLLFPGWTVLRHITGLLRGSMGSTMAVTPALVNLRVHPSDSLSHTPSCILTSWNHMYYITWKRKIRSFPVELSLPGANHMGMAWP